MDYQAFYNEVLKWFTVAKKDLEYGAGCALGSILDKYKPEPDEPVELVYPKGCGILGEDLDD